MPVSSPGWQSRALLGALALGQTASDSNTLILLQLIEDQHPTVRTSAAWALGQTASFSVLPNLLRALQDEEFGVRRAAAQALGQISCISTLPVLLKAIEDRDLGVQQNIADALGKFKDDLAAHVLPKLLTLIPTESGKVAFRALAAIQKRCQFYSYKIAQWNLAQLSSPASSSISYTTYNIDRVGNLNTGTVTIHGNQNGEDSNL